ncbi:MULTISPECIES: hypothetical protein [unclassified Variovorax]|uniref:hypothetical protein n=1 Tax=unclassified Variovorax TaxID=663243 RepID=UPI00076DCDF9|nr:MULTISPECIES: hypothetical protein [unclassified Variovorax]KWT98480.1 hypothetical protein APY03_0615 [Variovorax sp. WDL1]PNG49845.1 hypothetical protein CHC06_05426 [Variovorax sp. B2]PNG50717.1 hypothetical protein CHC07_05331 [Variovorax sp. B4]VTU42361.1 hypothetical protein H6P1_00167 [Variovorax sp. PBL-H6]VTU44015.1 hypothetical protein SRS16P1_00735 [Variovorax sp. SRS16]
MPNKIVFIGNWRFFEGRKYWHTDIDLVADMRRKGVRDGKLHGVALEAFVVACLRTPDYQVLGVPMDAQDYAAVSAAALEAA